CRDYPGRVVVSLDCRPDGELATRGWTHNSGRYLEETLIELSSAGVAAFLVAEAGRDALTEPPNLEILTDALKAVDEPVIAAGGVRDLDDLRQVVGLEHNGRRLAGIIVGREVTAGRFTMAEAKDVMATAGPTRPPGHVEGLRALLRVSNFERSRAFYEQMLGFRRVTGWERPHGDGIVLEAKGGETLELLGPPPGQYWPKPTGIELGFFVESVEKWHQHLRRLGVPITRELRQEAWGDLVFGVDDPDGVRVWFGQQK
ncbi:MAG TPA: HisA/HisF-related TIM barrel protein, partial [Acidimicrobiia bacterium]